MLDSILATLFTVSMPFIVDDPADDPRISMVVDELQRSRAIIQSAHIEWTRTTVENGFLTPTRVLSTRSHYSCDLSGDNVAIDATEEMVYQGADGTAFVGSPVRIVSMWNGTEFWASLGDPTEQTEFAVLNHPQFRQYHNILGIIFRSELGDVASIRADSFIPPSPPGVERQISLAEYAGEPVLRIEYSNDTAMMVLSFSLEKGGYLLAEEWYENGIQSMATTVEIGDSLGVWFPSVIESRSIRNDGVVTLMNRWEINLQNSHINSRAGVDHGYTMSPSPGSELSDYRGPERVNYVVGKDVPTHDQLDELVKKARDLSVGR